VDGRAPYRRGYIDLWTGVLSFVDVVFASSFAVAQRGLNGGDVVQSAPDVLTSSLFPRFTDKRLPLGQPIEVLLNFKNTGRKTYNVTAIRGFFLDPHDHNGFVQNFSAFRYDQMAPPGYEISFSYLFMADDMLELKEYMFYGDLYYTDESGGQYFTPYHNSSVTVYDASTPLDPQYLFTYVLLIGIIGGIGYIVSKVLGGKKGSKRSKSSAPSTPSATDRNEWINDSNVKGWKDKKNK